MTPGDENLGPPGGRDDEGRPPPKRGADHAEPAATKAPRYNRKGSPSRRHSAALRLPPIGPCGCIRDPDHDRHYCGDATTETMVDGAVQAAHHLLAEGLPPVFDLDTVAAVGRRGGDDRQLARQLYELVGGDGA